MSTIPYIKFFSRRRTGLLESESPGIAHFDGETPQYGYKNTAANSIEDGGHWPSDDRMRDMST
jgi:hypothetical protein